MTHPLLDQLLTEVDAPVRRVVFARGVEAWRNGDGIWKPPPDLDATGHAPASRTVPPAAPLPADAALSAIGLRPVGHATPAPEPLGTAAAEPNPLADPVAVGARHGLAPLLLVTSGGAEGSSGAATHLVSAAGTLGWRPPLERLYDDRVLGARALRLRFLLDAIEHHATGAAEAYAAAAAAARRTAALFDTGELTTLAGQTALFVELDALLSSVQRTYLAGARLLAAAFPPRRTRDGGHAPAATEQTFDALVLGVRTAPAELRETLLAAWEAHGMHAAAYRRALRRRDAVELGHAPVRLARLACGVWAVSVPVPTPPNDGLSDGAPAGTRAPRRRVDALERTWAIATDVMRVVSLVVYAVSER